MKEADWVIIDTETDGLYDPIHVIEIAGQRMRGWDPVGEPFRVLLNHGVPIPYEATAVHNYTEEYLQEHGVNPIKAYQYFREYAGELPLVAHNLSFDWNRALHQEWCRMGLEPIGQRGFCTLMLSRRVIDESKSYSLGALRTTFNLTSKNAHNAFADVQTVVDLFQNIFRPRLQGSGLETFTAVAEFSKKTPVAKCLNQCRTPAKKPTTVAGLELDKWYYLDTQNESRGPTAATEIIAALGTIPCWVWKEGMPDWISSESGDFQKFAKRLEPATQQSTTPRPQNQPARSINELMGLGRGLVADGKITTAEVTYLSKWLEEAGVITEWPATEIADLIEKIMEDGVVTKEEKTELLNLLQRVCVL